MKKIIGCTLFCAVCLFLVLELVLAIKDAARNTKGDGVNPSTTVLALALGYDRSEDCVLDEIDNTWFCGTGDGYLVPLKNHSVVELSKGTKAFVVWWRRWMEVIPALLLLFPIVGLLTNKRPTEPTD